ncbi:hypothetical protein [Nonomuraea cavernae]|nr:hypothetical protein [Nonomuraea cavernae]
MVVAAGKHASQGMPIGELTLRIFTMEFGVEPSESATKNALAWYIENRMGGILRHVYKAAGGEANEEEQEDKATQAAQTYINILNPKLRRLLRQHPRWKAAVDLSITGVLGPSAIGADVLAEALNVTLGGDDDSYEYLRSRLEKYENSGELQQSRGFFPAPDLQVEIMQQHDYRTVVRARDAVVATLGGMFLYHICSIKAPNHPRVQAAEMLSSISPSFNLLRAIPITGRPNWDTSCKYIIYLLLVEKIFKEWELLGSVLLSLFQGHVRDILRTTHIS